MYHLFFSENTDKYKNPISPAFEKPRKNRNFPYIHDNKFNQYNKNTIKMKKLKNSYEESINLFIKENPIKNIKYINTKSTQTTNQLIKKYSSSNTYKVKDKYCSSYLNTKAKFNCPKEKRSKIEYQISTSPMFFSSDNFTTENEIEKIKFIETDYSSGSLNTDRHKENNYPKIIGELENQIEETNIHTNCKDFRTPSNKLVTERKISKLIKSSNLKTSKKIISNGNEVFMTKMDNSSKLETPSHTSLKQSHIKNKSQELYETYSEEFYSLPIEKYSSPVKLRNPMSLKSKLISYYSSVSEKENKNKPNDIANQYTKFENMSRNSKNFINKISSFSKKLNSELGNFSTSYGRPENHIKFSENPLTNKCFETLIKFDAYRNFKISESRNTHNYRFKLAPLNGDTKYDKLDKFGNKFFLLK